MKPPASLAAAVVRWQRQHGRHGLPWQANRDPYRVWLSEIMLQQTQVQTVLAYFERFLQRFPDLPSLAQAPLDDVLAQWSGLGYYSRARNLHRCAQTIQTQHGGAFPQTSQALAQLPGIGRSTAAAIAAFCFGERAAILDGNVKRVLTRALGFEGDLSQAGPQRELWALAESLLPRSGVDTYTQGLMDLGSSICTLRRPQCGACPLAEQCVAKAQGQPTAYPVKTRRIKRGTRSHALLLMCQGRAVWLMQRPPTGVWAGLWSLPEWADAETLADLVAKWPGSGTALPVIEHALTHFDWRLAPLHWQLPARLSERNSKAIFSSLPDGRWFSRDEALALGLAAPIRALLMQLPG